MRGVTNKARWQAYAVCAFACSAAMLPGPAAAQEAVKYVYDARGRLIEVHRTQPNVVVKTKHDYDRADNRTKKEVTTTPR
jgi:hypothetical protein